MDSPDSRNDIKANPQSQAVNGHWIKMFKALWDHPKVASMCEILKCTEALLIGALFRLWSLADTHSTDGRLDLSAFALNRKVGVEGFAEAVTAVGWLEIGNGFVVVVRFDEHNGQSAKRRAQDAVRAAKYRQSAQLTDGVTHPSRTERDGCVTQSKRKSKRKNSKAECAGRSPPLRSDQSPPFEDIELYWNESLSVSQTMTDSRRKKLHTRWRDPTFRNRWREAIDRINQTPVCRGRNDRGWVADVDWFLQPDSLTKLFEGKYDNRNPTNAQGSSNTAGRQSSAARREQANADAFQTLYNQIDAPEDSCGADALVLNEEST